ncbi:hypothetical protein D3C75_1290990 [compost metagenome]
MGVEAGIAVGQFFHMAQQCVFIQRLRHRHRSLIADSLGDIGEQFLHGLNPDSLHHLLAVLLGHRQITVLHCGFTPWLFL